MSIVTKALGHVATAKTFAMAFWPWLLGAFLLGAASSIWPAYKVTKLFYKGEAQEARLATAQCRTNLADFSAQLATNAAEAERIVGETVAAAERRIAARDADISARVARIPSEVARQLQPELLAFRSAINADPNLACLDLALPGAALRVLERPGGPVRSDSPEGGRGPD